jgi:hypothetical protein
MPKVPVASFTIAHNGRVNRIITDIELFPAFDPTSIPTGLVPYKTKALWDTGASSSVVSKKTAEDMKLVPTGTTRMSSAGGVDIVNTYTVNIGLPNKVGFPGVRVAQCSDESGDFGAIIGMDIITSGDLAITNTPQTVMSFRIPSIKKIDFVEDAKYLGVGSKDPCPCGKKDGQGKPIRFKHCHGRKKDT